MRKKNKGTLDIKPSQNEKERVLIDLDGVTRDFIGSLIRFYKQEYPDHHIEEVNSRRLEDFFQIGEEIYKFMEAGRIEQIMEEAEPYPGALEALNYWQKQFEIIVVTAQPEVSRAATYRWIGKHNIPTNEVHITYYKSRIPGIALLDDFVDNLEEFAETGRLAVCLDQPWNREWKGPRVHSLDEFFKLVKNRYHKS
ncbi:MAG: hypothetical protein Kow0042_22460 [Calditrichia bacterium]